jgi:hypothetical protein
MQIIIFILQFVIVAVVWFYVGYNQCKINLLKKAKKELDDCETIREVEIVHRLTR